MGAAATDAYDYIVVGAGSAGCVLAARLSRGPGTRACCCSRPAPRTARSGSTCRSATARRCGARRYNWCFHTDPDPNMNGRRIYWPRGKTLGGSSSINGLIYIRGQREDYDHWAALGNAGWGYDDVLPLLHPQSEAQPARRDALPRRRRPAAVSRHRREARADRGLHRRRRRDRRAAHRRLQRRARRKAPATTSSPPGRAWRCSTAKAYLRRRAPSRQPARRDRGAGHAARVRRHAAPSACATARAAPTQVARCRGRSAAGRRRDPVAAAAAAVGHRPGGAAAAARHRGRARSRRASARTCRTTCRSA